MAAYDTCYGLDATAFSEDIHRVHRAARSLRAGTLWVDCFFVRDLRAPVGGRGLRRRPAGGSSSRERFTEPRAAVVQSR
ncbi:MAG: aldehyde dehydrogenase family protein [Actinomycetota bacterium]|nr:aldehyde dehydrogenase family protein [Actinomycetota bacterium]